MTDPAEIVREYSDCAYSLAYRITGNRDDAYDIVQDAFIAVLDKFDQVENKKAYLLKAVYNHALNRLKKNKKLIYQTAPLEPISETQPDIEYENQASDQKAREKLSQLSEKQREIITYRFWGDLKLVEIARLLKINEATVRVHLSRGLNKLRELFSKGVHNEM